jgi:hypothetical protein
MTSAETSQPSRRRCGVAAMDAPDLLTEDLRKFFRMFR